MSLFVHIALASLKVMVEARANVVRNDLKKRAHELDASHPGSTFAQELASDGKYIFLSRAPLLTTFSCDFILLWMS